ncbi:MAG: hypothetical protein Q8L34_04320 [Candidatus Woesearchaeota archaeon]|nr:hypothetical protein [Candidatus Woesearchaeota archaeon]
MKTNTKAILLTLALGGLGSYALVSDTIKHKWNPCTVKERDLPRLVQYYGGINQLATDKQQDFDGDGEYDPHITCNDGHIFAQLSMPKRKFGPYEGYYNITGLDERAIWKNEVARLRHQ